MTTKLILLRHGITSSNLRGIFLGRTDVELSFMGKKQVKSASKWLAQNTKIDIIYSSALKRAISTAFGLNCYFNSEILVSKKLNEMDFGEWEGKRHDDVAVCFPEKYTIWENLPHMHTIPGAENIIDIHKRVTDFVKEILEKHEGKTICIVTHGVCLRILMAFIKGYDISQINKISWHENAAISTIDYLDGCFTIERENFTGFLSDDLKANTYPDIEKLLLNNEWKNMQMYV